MTGVRRFGRRPIPMKRRRMWRGRRRPQKAPSPAPQVQALEGDGEAEAIFSMSREELVALLGQDTFDSLAARGKKAALEALARARRVLEEE